MTFTEMLAWPYEKMTLEEYEQLLNEKRKSERSLHRISDKIFDEEDSLVVLADEAESERYKQHAEELKNLEARKRKIEQKIADIDEKLRR